MTRIALALGPFDLDPPGHFGHFCVFLLVAVLWKPQFGPSAIIGIRRWAGPCVAWVARTFEAGYGRQVRSYTYFGVVRGHRNLDRLGIDQSRRVGRHKRGVKQFRGPGWVLPHSTHLQQDGLLRLHVLRLD